MRPEPHPSSHVSQGQPLASGDWDAMFCAVLARLSAAMAPLDLKSNQGQALSECLESLHWLRQAALLNWVGCAPGLWMHPTASLPGTAPAAQTGE